MALDLRKPQPGDVVVVTNPDYFDKILQVGMIGVVQWVADKGWGASQGAMKIYFPDLEHTIWGFSDEFTYARQVINEHTPEDVHL